MRTAFRTAPRCTSRGACVDAFLALAAPAAAPATTTTAAPAPAAIVVVAAPAAAVVIAGVALSLAAAAAAIVVVADVTPSFAAASAAAPDLERPPTIWFGEPAQLEAGGRPLDFHVYAAPRLVDWDGDGLPDILVGCGDGAIRIVRNHGTAGQPAFAAPEDVRSLGAPVRISSAKTGACFADLTGDGLPDLVAGGGPWWLPADLRLYANCGLAGQPAFCGYVPLRSGDGPLQMRGLVEGRIDIVDFDGDGLLDVLAGDWDGSYWFARNVGSSVAPDFAPPARVTQGGSPIRRPYNTYPEFVDMDRDGTADLASGENWGGFFFWPVDRVTPGVQPELRGVVSLFDAHGGELNVRSLTGDDSMPAIADLDGDGYLDIVTGADNGKLFLMEGSDPARRFERANELMERGRHDLPDRLAGDPAFRDEIFGIHRAAGPYVRDVVRLPAQRARFAEWYADHVTRFPEWLRRGYKDPATFGLVPWLGAQVHVAFAASLAGPEQRPWLADTIGLTAGPRRTWLDYGTLLADNDRCNGEQQYAVTSFLGALPRAAWDAEVISVADYLGPSPAAPGIAARTGVNIFGTDVGNWGENPFPPDGPRGIQNNVFTIVLAHEITHTIDAHFVQEDPLLDARRRALLARAGLTDLQYLRSQVGAAYFQQNPQEFLASIGNQYFGDTSATLGFARDRFDRGYREPLDQFLFFADVLSLGGDVVPFYSISPWISGGTTVASRPAVRDDQGRLAGIRIGRTDVSFDLDEDGHAVGHAQSQWNRRPVARCGPPAATWECTGAASAAGTLDASASTDPEGDPLSFRWAPPSEPCVFADPGAAVTRATCPLGVWGAWVDVDDGLRDPASCFVQLTSVDTTPPAGRIVAPAAGACLGAPGAVVVVDDFVDVCFETVERSYDPGPGPVYAGHGDHRVLLTARDARDNATSAEVRFTIDVVAPTAQILAPRDGAVLSRLGQPLALLFASADDDGATGGVVRETVSLAGCAVLDGAQVGDGDGLLTDETLALDPATLCPALARCGLARLHDPELRFAASDCGGNTGGAAVTLRGDVSLEAFCGSAAAPGGRPG